MDKTAGQFETARMMTLEQARERVLAAIAPLPAETMSLTESHGRVLAEDVLAPMDLPVFDNSAMDGYAVRAADVAGAKPDAPVALRLIGQVAAGEVFSRAVQPGTSVRIFTGSPLPDGADAVVMQEDARGESGAGQRVLILEGAKPYEHVRLRGEDVKRGALASAAGERLSAGRTALLAALGLGEIRVRRRPVIGLLATGSELIEPGEAWRPGKVYESNRAMLAPLVRQAGGEVRVFPLVADSLAETKAAMQAALEGCDGVVTSGGVSVGELDFVKQAFQELGGTLDFWRVSIRPGKPFVFGGCRGRVLFGLPGNPVSAFVTFLLLVRPALLRWQGARTVDLPTHPGVLAEPLINRGDRRHLMRVQVDAAGRVTLAGGQSSHVLSALAAANGLVDVPPETVWAAGSEVKVLRLETC